MRGLCIKNLGKILAIASGSTRIATREKQLLSESNTSPEQCVDIHQFGENDQNGNNSYNFRNYPQVHIVRKALTHHINFN